jgi:Biotin-lipoyl like
MLRALEIAIQTALSRRGVSVIVLPGDVVALGRGDEIIDLAKVNLFRYRGPRRRETEGRRRVAAGQARRRRKSDEAPARKENNVSHSLRLNSPLVLAVSVARSLLEGLLIVVVAVLTAGCGDASRAGGAPPPPVVKVEPVVERDVPISVEYVGTLVGYINAQIRARVSGHLFSQNYTEGSLVKAGDLLFQVDPRPFETAAEQAEARLSLAESQLSQAKAQVTASRAQVEQAMATVVQDEAQVKRAGRSASKNSTIPSRATSPTSRRWRPRGPRC